MREFLLYVAIYPHTSEYLSTILHILWARRFRPGVITHHGPLCAVPLSASTALPDSLFSLRRFIIGFASFTKHHRHVPMRACAVSCIIGLQQSIIEA